MNPAATSTLAPMRFASACVPPTPEPSAARAPRLCGALATLPLLRRPGRVGLLAEDPALVDALVRSLPRRWRLRPFSSASGCLYALQQEPPAWEADFWAQQDLLARWRDGAALVPLVLRYWAASPQRRALTSVAVVDAFMTGLGGMEMLSELVGFEGRRVLMAGGFDREQARAAFAEGCIDRFVLKRDATLRADLLRVVDGLLAQAHPRHQALWSATLQPWQLAALRRPGVARDLHALLQAHCVEWVVLPEPFGVLGLDAGGGAHFLQLEDRARCDALALRARATGVSPAGADGVRSGRLLANLELRDALGLPGTDLLPARTLGGPDGLLAACTRIDLTAGPRSARPAPAFRPVAASGAGIRPSASIRDLSLVPAAG